MLTWFFFQKPLIKIYFLLHKLWGYAKSIPSVNPLLLNRDVNKIQSNCTEKEFWEINAKNEGLSL